MIHYTSVRTNTRHYDAASRETLNETFAIDGDGPVSALTVTARTSVYDEDEWARGQVNGGKTMQSFVSSVAGGATSALVRNAFGGKMDTTAVLADMFGSAIGNSIVDKMRPRPIAQSGSVDELQEVKVTARYILDEVEVTARRLDNNARLAVLAIGLRVLMPTLAGKGSTEMLVSISAPIDSASRVAH